MAADTKPDYDIIFAGGGTAGCLIAGRLAKSNPSLRILVLEQGDHTLNKPIHVQPARYPFHLAPGSTTLSFQVSQPNPNANGRSIVVPCGRCLGGGSSVNFLMYTRAVRSDYDDWETVYKNPGWGSKDLVPLLRKTETYTLAPDLPTHGYSGPLNVSHGSGVTQLGEDFIDACVLFDKTRPVVHDIQNLECSNGYGHWGKWIDPVTGRRSDVPHNFIYNQREGSNNLEIITQAKVKRVIFEENRAVGVEYVADKTLQPDADQTVRTVRAPKIVISAGAFGSPAILERSGIGSAEILNKHDIPVKVDLPGVGEGYQDHNLLFMPSFAADEAESLDPFLFGNPEFQAEWEKTWNETGKGMLAHNGVDTGSKIRPNEEDLKELGPEFADRWRRYYAPAEDKPVIWIGLVNYFLGYPRDLPPRKCFVVAMFTEHPASTGYTHITSSDPHAPLNFHNGYLTDPGDVAVLRWGFKRGREIARRMKSYRGDYLPALPKFAEGSAAAYDANLSAPVGEGVPPIVYTKEDDKVLEDWIRDKVATSWHSCSTCSMKPREMGGVVDSKLNVYGVEGLKVADLSIIPGNVAANTYSTALVVAEKAAVIIAEEMGLALE